MASKQSHWLVNPCNQFQPKTIAYEQPRKLIARIQGCSTPNKNNKPAITQFTIKGMDVMDNNQLKAKEIEHSWINKWLWNWEKNNKIYLIIWKRAYIYRQTFRQMSTNNISLNKIIE